MSAPKFTPGPWVAVIRDPKTAGVRTAWTIESDSRVCIAWGQSQEHIADGIHADECNANAHLAAAAPELYDSLEEAVVTIESLRGWMRNLLDLGEKCQATFDDSGEVAERIRAALAKAVPQ